MDKKVEDFLRIEHGEPDDGWCVEELADCGAIGSYFKNNVEVGEKVSITLIQGTRKSDPTGNFNYTVEEVKEKPGENGATAMDAIY